MNTTDISFGLNVRQPSRLETRNTGDVLFGIQSGAWQDPVVRVRSLPPDSPEQRAAKLALPYATWAGVFARRSNSALVQHSGQVGVDLDGLGDRGATGVIQTAVADKHCLAAFRSARGEGVRLLFRVPQCSAREHPAVFEQVAEHVRRVYEHEPDPSGSDVSRASFVSFDAGLWLYARAELLPVKLPGLQHSNFLSFNCCVARGVYGGQLAVTCWDWYGRHFANTSPRPDGTVKTHHSLLGLGKAVALHAERISEPLTDRSIGQVFHAWIAEHERNGVALRRSADEYRAELVASVKGAKRKKWFMAAVEKWTRWTRHVDFPKAGTPDERLLFAIGQHCAEAGTNEFYLGARDAALITGGHFTTGSRWLKKLIVDGHLENISVANRPLRHAFTYRVHNSKKE